MGTLGASLDALVASFNERIMHLHNLLAVRSVGTHAVELKEAEAAVGAMEHHMRVIKAFLKREAESVSKLKAMLELLLLQSVRLQQICANLPARLPGIQMELSILSSTSTSSKSSNPTTVPAEPAAPKAKKGRNPIPRWYITVDELSSLSSYMRGRLTLDKLNSAIDEMASFAETNARLLSAPKLKLGENAWSKVLELRDIAAVESIKGRHFFLESDLRGELLKLDHTGKAILTVLRHLGRLNEVRCGRIRVFALLKS